mgnify:CR=1 FL=1
MSTKGLKLNLRSKPDSQKFPGKECLSFISFLLNSGWSLFEDQILSSGYVPWRFMHYCRYCWCQEFEEYKYTGKARPLCTYHIWEGRIQNICYQGRRLLSKQVPFC